jgi:integrase
MAKPTKIRPPKRHEREWGEGTVKEVRPGVWRAWRARQGSVRPSQTFRGDGAEQRATLWARGHVEPPVLLLGHWLDRWLALRLPLVRPNTRRNYERHVDLCLPLAMRPLAELADVDAWQALTNDLLDRYARSSVQVWRATISGALKAAVPRYLPSNPMASVRLPRAEERPVKAWRRDEVERLVGAAKGKAHETWLWLALGTGIRLGEARALLWTDVDFDERTITISKSLDHHTDEVGPTKNGRIRVVDLPDELLPVLRAQLARQRPGTRHVCTSRFTGELPGRGALEMWLLRLAAKADVKELPPHAARHTFATLSLEANVPLKEVSESLGHADMSITARIYSHAIERNRRRASSAMGAILAGTAPTRIRGNGTQDGTREAV